MQEKVTGSRYFNWLEIFGLALFYTAVFLIYTFPLVSHFSDGFPGFDTGNSDANQYIWNIYNFKRAVLAGSNPWFTDLLLYPKGSSLLFHTYTPVLGVFGLLFSNNIVAVNSGLLLSFVLSGIGAFWLSFRLVPNKFLALITGLVFAFSPYKTAHLLEHYHLMLTATIPFFVLSFLKAFTFISGKFWPAVKSVKAVIVCFLLGFITLLSDYYALFFLLYFCGAYAIFYWLELGNINWRKPKPWLILGAVFLIAPQLVRLLKKWGVSDKGGLWWGGDLAGYLLPPDNLRWFSTETSQKLYATESIFNNPGSVENVVFLGWTLLVLTVFAIFKSRKFKPEPFIKPFIFLAFLFWLITMPELSVFGKIWFRTPTALLHFIPFFNNIRCPTRAVVMLTLFLPIVCFYFLHNWLLLKNSWLQKVIPVLLLFVIFLEFQPKATPLITKANMPKAYAEIAKAKGEVAFILPLGIRDGFQEKGHVVLNDLFYQTQHGKKMPGAYISRIDQKDFDSFDADPVMKVLTQLSTDSTFLPPYPNVLEEQQFFNRYKPDVFLLTPRVKNPHANAYLENLLSGRFQKKEIEDCIIWQRIQE